MRAESSIVPTILPSRSDSPSMTPTYSLAALPRRSRCAEEFGIHLYRRERCPELVSHIRDEVRFQPVELLQAPGRHLLQDELVLEPDPPEREPRFGGDLHDEVDVLGGEPGVRAFGAQRDAAKCDLVLVGKGEHGGDVHARGVLRGDHRVRHTGLECPFHGGRMCRGPSCAGSPVHPPSPNTRAPADPGRRAMSAICRTGMTSSI